jgi:iron complex outermembrane recepter protein
MKKAFIGLFFIVSFFGRGSYAQSLEILGSVKDQNKEAIVGASVFIPEANVFAMADQNGFFKLKAPSKYPVKLTVSFVGFKSQDLILAAFPEGPLELILEEDMLLSEVVILSRRRQEEVQAVPIPITVLSGALLEDAQAFNVNRVKEIVPTVQLYSSNPRNTTLNIRGLGSTFGLTNDGIEPGVGFYVDGVYYARAAVTALDFVDVDQIEILRGPQGTLFGKNSTAGAFNITSKRPKFKSGGTVETSFGNYGFVQSRGSFTGPLSPKIAGRLSFSGTHRNGLLHHVGTGKDVNTLDNLGLKGQMLFLPTERLEVLLSADLTRQRPVGYAQVVAGVVQTQRPSFRQFDQIVSDLGYSLPSSNPFDRLIDHDTPWRSGNDLGGISVNADYTLGEGTLTATSAWRYWNWDPSNDRDFTGLQALSLSQAPSRHDQWSQEVRYAGDFSNRISGVLGVFMLGQKLNSNPFHTEESGVHQWRFVQNNQNPLWQTPNLLEGYGIRTRSSLESFSGAVFAQVDWKLTDKLKLMPGIRWNYDSKNVDYERTTYGGLDTFDPQLIALQQLVYIEQSFRTTVAESNFSGQISSSYIISDKINAYTTYSTSFKPVGVNLGGLPRENGETMIQLARVAPEYVQHVEAGFKSKPTTVSVLNITAFYTGISNFQTLVQTPDLAVNRGYLANAERVRVQGIEIDGNTKIRARGSIFAAMAYTDAIYVSFANAPVPLEEVGGETFKDISGGRMPGISKFAGSLGGELTFPKSILGSQGYFFLGMESFFRSGFSSSPSPSAYLNVNGYALANGRFGYKSGSGFSGFIWSRNMTNTQYFEQLLPGAGNVGHYAAVLGDPMTIGLTIRYALGSDRIRH